MTHKPKKAITAQEQYQMDLQLEIDLTRLVKQEKYYERERGTYTSGAKMAKQQKLIRILEKEQHNVCTDLFIATCSTKKKEDSHITTEMTTLLHENDFFEEGIKEKKSYLKEIDDQIVMVKKRVISARSKIIGDVQYAAKVLMGQKTLESLENKLDTVVKRFCIIQTGNNKLREEIQHLFTERTSFNILWERLITNLDKGKQFMIDIIEQASIAYNERDEWVTKLHALRSRAHNDLIMQTEEMLGLQRHQDDYKKLKHFFDVKGQKRVMRDLQFKERLKRKQRREAMNAHLHECKQILADILEFTQIATTDEFCAKYAVQEENKYAMLVYIAELNQEMEELTHALVTLHTDIDINIDINQQRAQHQTDNLIKLNEELGKTIKEADISQAQVNSTNAKLKDIYLGVLKLFKICKGDAAPILQLLGDNTTINHYNVLLYLKMLEDRVSELILDVYYNQKSSRKKEKFQQSFINEDEVARPIQQIKNIIPTNPCPLCVDQEMVSDVIDTLQIVQTRDEVKVKLERRLALPDGLERLHNVSACHLPKSRQIMQRRYQ